MSIILLLKLYSASYNTASREDILKTVIAELEMRFFGCSDMLSFGEISPTFG